MKNLKAKMKKKAGFTLIEMLIVVAIVAILIAISIPLVGTALEGARDATDQANERAAKMAAVAYHLSGDTDIISDAGEVDEGTGGAFTAVYDAEKGKLVKEANKPAAYGKCKGCGDTARYPNSDTDHTTKVIKVEVDAKGVVKISWVDGKA